MGSERGRWPGWVYAEGEEPDYRFSLANERTLLAWLRTALALLAAGVALDQIDLEMRAELQQGLAAALVLLGVVCAAASWWRWASAERAIRHHRPLPSSLLGLLLAVATVAIGVVVLVGL
jgi:putative membrane protein